MVVERGRNGVISICHPYNCLNWNVFVANANIIVARIRWRKETQFQVALSGDYGLVWKQRLAC